MTALTIPAGKPQKVQVKFQDANGQPATVDGDVRWASSDTSVATVSAQRPDTSIAVVTGVKLGNAVITASGDADLGAGVQTLTTKLDVTVSTGQAVSGTISPVTEGVGVGGGPAEPPPPHGPGGGGEHPDHGLPGGPPGHVGGGPVPPSRPVDPGYGQGHPVPPHGPGSGGEHPDHDLPGGPPGHASTQPLPGERPHVGGGPVNPPGHASGQPVPPKPEGPEAKPQKKKW